MAWLKMLDLLVIINMTDDDTILITFLLSFFLFQIFMGEKINPFSLINKYPIKIMVNLLVNIGSFLKPHMYHESRGSSDWPQNSIDDSPT